MSKFEVSTQDRKEIEKFVKYLIYKFVQTVVQSRQGVRSATRSKLFGSSDWFNLSIRDQPEVLEATKRAYEGRSVSLAQPLCVEISLRTLENETMTLEYWCLQMTEQTSLPESSFKVPMTVYNLIGLMLKSIITVTRSTPAYQLARQQSTDTYCICYHICFHEPTSFDTGSLRRQHIATVPSPLGTVIAYVVYRTELSVCPHQLIPDLTSTIKDDHFNAPPCWNRHTRLPRRSDGGDGEQGLEVSPGTSPAPNEMIIHHAATSPEAAWARQKKPAFGSAAAGDKESAATVVNADLPFMSLLQHANAITPPVTATNLLHYQGDDLHGDSKDTSGEQSAERAKEESGASVDTHDLASFPVRDDFVMVELKAPFAGQEDELGRFYRDCQMAPALSMFEQTTNLQEMLCSITDQLAQFEASANEFNEFVSSLQELD